MNYRRTEWGRNPCGCRGCHVCSFFGDAPRYVPPAEDEPEPEKKERTLFDEPQEARHASHAL